MRLHLGLVYFLLIYVRLRALRGIALAWLYIMHLSACLVPGIFSFMAWGVLRKHFQRCSLALACSNIQSLADVKSAV
jgi:hypothetical protein